MSRSGGTLALIPARGGSKGIPRKNIRSLGGKPLIAYAIQTALASQLIDRVVVSTEDREIAEIAQQYGAEIPFMRPEPLAADDSPEWLTWQHAIRTLESEETSSKIKVFVCVPPTSPLRSVEDVDACIETLLDSDADIVITVKESERSPYFNMVAINGEDYAQLVIPPRERVYRRQDVPPVFDMTTVAYAARPQFVLNASSIFEGKVKAVVVPAERAIDIDTELDFKFAEFLLSQPQSAKQDQQAP